MVSIDSIQILVNKDHILDRDYCPKDLVYTDNNENNFHNFLNPNLKPSVSKETYAAFYLLKEAALKDGLKIIIDSGFRSYEYQQEIWNDSILKKGLEYTKQFIAPPGASEHQTGLAVDIASFINNQIDDNITEESKEYKWMINNAYKYGFILRYPKGKEKITGYGFEPWHYRYVGTKLANTLKRKNITLEEYYKLK